jgi:NTE family protein
LSTPARPITSYFVNLGFTDIEEPERRRFFNAIPTSFSLTEEQIDGLIEAGHELLRNDPDYQQLLADLGGAQVPNR